MSTSISQHRTKTGCATKQAKCKTRPDPNGRKRTDRFSLMEDAHARLRGHLTDDSGHLEAFLSSYAGESSVEKMVMLINTRMTVVSPSESHRDYTPLGYAIVQNDPLAVDVLVRCGACVQSAPCTSAGNADIVFCPLHLALMHQCQPVIVECLIEHGASIANIERRDVSNLFHYIGRCRCKTTADALMSKVTRFDVTDKDKRTLLHLATINGNSAVARSVMNTRQVGIDKIDAMGKTALMYAAERNSPVITQLLLDGGAAVNLTDGWGRTALHFAVRRASLKTITMLLSSGASVGAKDRKGLTPFTYASSCDSILHTQSPKEDVDELYNCLTEYATTPISLDKREFVHVAFVMTKTCANETAIIRLIANNRNHASQRNSNGQTLIHVAAEYGKHDVVKWLLKEGCAAPITSDSAGWQPLHYAAKGGNRETMLCLLKQHGVDVNSCTPGGWTPIWILVRNGWTDLARDVVRYGCDVERTMPVSALRQADSHYSLPLSLFDPPAQRASPVAYARSGSRRLTIAAFAAECGLAELTRLLNSRPVRNCRTVART